MKGRWFLIIVAALTFSGLVSLPAQAGVIAEDTVVKTVRYGPFTVSGGSMEMPGMYDAVKLGVRRPCWDCYLTSMRANVTYVDGSTANFDTGMMLHHMVLTNQWRRDATCYGAPLGIAGERFFASGNERTLISLPSGYGYRLRWYDSWNMFVSLMNMNAAAQTVYVDVSFSYKSLASSVQTVRPVWLDIDNCGDSEYSISAGESAATWHWKPSFSARVVSAAGHLHDYGVHISATNATSGAVICDSYAGYGTKPAYLGHIESMETCVNANLATFKAGDHLTLSSHYNAPEPQSDVMGIMLIYVRPLG